MLEAVLDFDAFKDNYHRKGEDESRIPRTNSARLPTDMVGRSPHVFVAIESRWEDGGATFGVKNLSKFYDDMIKKSLIPKITEECINFADVRQRTNDDGNNNRIGGGEIGTGYSNKIRESASNDGSFDKAAAVTSQTSQPFIKVSPNSSSRKGYTLGTPNMDHHFIQESKSKKDEMMKQPLPAHLNDLFPSDQFHYSFSDTKITTPTDRRNNNLCCKSPPTFRSGSGFSSKNNISFNNKIMNVEPSKKTNIEDFDRNGNKFCQLKPSKMTQQGIGKKIELFNLTSDKQLVDKNGSKNKVSRSTSMLITSTREKPKKSSAPPSQLESIQHFKNRNLPERDVNKGTNGVEEKFEIKKSFNLNVDMNEGYPLTLPTLKNFPNLNSKDNLVSMVNGNFPLQLYTNPLDGDSNCKIKTNLVILPFERHLTQFQRDESQNIPDTNLKTIKDNFIHMDPSILKSQNEKIDFGEIKRVKSDQYSDQENVSPIYRSKRSPEYSTPNGTVYDAPAVLAKTYPSPHKDIKVTDIRYSQAKSASYIAKQNPIHPHSNGILRSTPSVKGQAPTVSVRKMVIIRPNVSSSLPIVIDSETEAVAIAANADPLTSLSLAEKIRMFTNNCKLPEATTPTADYSEGANRTAAIKRRKTICGRMQERPVLVTKVGQTWLGVVGEDVVAKPITQSHSPARGEFEQKFLKFELKPTRDDAKGLGERMGPSDRTPKTGSVQRGGHFKRPIMSPNITIGSSVLNGASMDSVGRQEHLCDNIVNPIQIKTLTISTGKTDGSPHQEIKRKKLVDSRNDRTSRKMTQPITLMEKRDFNRLNEYDDFPTDPLPKRMDGHDLNLPPNCQGERAAHYDKCDNRDNFPPNCSHLTSVKKYFEKMSGLAEEADVKILIEPEVIRRPPTTRYVSTTETGAVTNRRIPEEEIDINDSWNAGTTTKRNGPRDETGNETPTALQFKCDLMSTPSKGTKLLDQKLDQLQQSREKWKDRVGEKDVEQFTVEGKMKIGGLGDNFCSTDNAQAHTSPDDDCDNVAIATMPIGFQLNNAHRKAPEPKVFRSKSMKETCMVEFFGYENSPRTYALDDKGNFDGSDDVRIRNEPSIDIVVSKAEINTEDLGSEIKKEIASPYQEFYTPIYNYSPDSVSLEFDSLKTMPKLNIPSKAPPPKGRRSSSKNTINTPLRDSFNGDKKVNVTGVSLENIQPSLAYNSCIEVMDEGESFEASDIVTDLKLAKGTTKNGALQLELRNRIEKGGGLKSHGGCAVANNGVDSNTKRHSYPATSENWTIRDDAQCNTVPMRANPSRVKTSNRKSMSGVGLAKEALDALAAKEDFNSVILKPMSTSVTERNKRYNLNLASDGSTLPTNYDDYPHGNNSNGSLGVIPNNNYNNNRDNKAAPLVTEEDDSNTALPNPKITYLIQVKGRRHVQCRLITPDLIGCNDGDGTDMALNRTHEGNTSAVYVDDSCRNDHRTLDNSRDVGVGPSGGHSFVNMNHGDSYVVVNEKCVCAWLGRFSNIIEKAKARDLANSIATKNELGFGLGFLDDACPDVHRADDSIKTDSSLSTGSGLEGGKRRHEIKKSKGITNTKAIEAKIIENVDEVYNESSSSNVTKELLATILSHNSKDAHFHYSCSTSLIQPSGPPSEDLSYENSIICSNMVYIVEDQQCLPLKEAWGLQLKHEILQRKRVLILDFGTEMYIWFGKNASLSSRKEALLLAKEMWVCGYNYRDCSVSPYSPLLTPKASSALLAGGSYCLTRRDYVYGTKRPAWALFQKQNQYMETSLFKTKFIDWPEQTGVVGSETNSCPTLKSFPNGIGSKNDNKTSAPLTLGTGPDIDNGSRMINRAGTALHHTGGKEITNGVHQRIKGVVSAMIDREFKEPNLVLEGTCLGRRANVAQSVLVDSGDLYGPKHNYTITIDEVKVWQVVQPTSPTITTTGEGDSSCFTIPPTTYDVNEKVTASPTTPRKAPTLVLLQPNTYHNFNNTDSYIVKVLYCVCTSANSSFTKLKHLRKNSGVNKSTTDIIDGGGGGRRISDVSNNKSPQMSPNLEDQLKSFVPAYADGSADDENLDPGENAWLPALKSLNQLSPSSTPKKEKSLLDDARSSTKGRNRYVYFFWQGRRSTLNEKGISALMTVVLDEENGPHVRVCEGKEPPFFNSLFNDSMIIRDKFTANDTPLAQPTSYTLYPRLPLKRLYMVRNTLPGEICLREIRMTRRTELRDRASYLIVVSDKLHGSPCDSSNGAQTMSNQNSHELVAGSSNSANALRFHGSYYMIWHGSQAPCYVRDAMKMATRRYIQNSNETDLGYVSEPENGDYCNNGTNRYKVNKGGGRKVSINDVDGSVGVRGACAGIGRNNLLEMEQGNEPPKLWDLVWGDGDIDVSAVAKQFSERLPSPQISSKAKVNTQIQRLCIYLMTSVSGEFEAKELSSAYDSTQTPLQYPFDQSDIYAADPPCIFMVDYGESVWLWQRFCKPLDSTTNKYLEEGENGLTGSAVSRFHFERHCALKVALEYAKIKGKRRCGLINSGYEPTEFKYLFPFWDDTLSAYDKKIEEYESDILATFEESVIDVAKALSLIEDRKYSIEELRTKPVHLDPLHLETYLSVDEFEQVFSMEFDQFYALPEWKRISIKRNLGLF